MGVSSIKMVFNTKKMNEIIQEKRNNIKTRGSYATLGNSNIREVVTPEFLQRRGFWAALWLQVVVWGLSIAALAEKEAPCMYLHCMFIMGSKGRGRLLL